MLCYERADALHKKEAEVRAIEVTDGQSLCEYLKGFWELIWNHKMFGYVYDIYSDDIKVIRENGIVIEGIKGVKQELLNLNAAFPDLRVHIEEIFAMPKGPGYEIWMRYYFIGTNTACSIYGPPSGLKMEGDKAINQSMYRVENIDGEWLITSEFTGRPCEYIRAICTGDNSFGHVKF